MRFNLDKIPVSDPKSVESFNDSTKKMKELRKEIDRQMKQLQKNFKAEFKLITKDFFTAVPQIKSITWTQYTPYFMDGDECVFEINDIFFATDTNKDMEDYREEDNDESFSGTLAQLAKVKFLTAEQKELCKTMHKLINSNEDIMKDIFGDHVLVVLRARGNYTEEYEHD